MEITRRYRVNVGTTAKGIHTYDCTVEVTAGTKELEVELDVKPIILAESDDLVAELDKKYPAVQE